MTGSPDREHLVQLIAQGQRRLSGYVRLLVPNRSDAEEVLQEVNLTLWRRGDEFRPESDFAAWSYAIARYQVLAYRKRRARDRLLFGEELLEQLADSALACAEGTGPRREALEHCVRKLTGRQRRLLHLRYASQAGMERLAEEIGRSVKSAYRILGKIHMNLLDCIRQRMSDQGERP
ncbi:MAG: sigma-70 family RNA polymerase sigma factor [Thermoguttaceae bacterium]